MLGLATASSLSALFFPPAAVIAKPGQQNAQRNLLIIHVDDLENDDPRLVSVWSMFAVSSEQTFITLKPLYPATTPDPALSELVMTFQLNAKKQPSQAFLKAAQAFQLKWDGYLLIDDEGLLLLNQWLTRSTDNSISVQANGNPDLILQNDVTLLNGICRGLGSAGLWPHKNAVWQTISPHHFRTNLKTKHLVNEWHALNVSQTTPVCNVFSR